MIIVRSNESMNTKVCKDFNNEDSNNENNNKEGKHSIECLPLSFLIFVGDDYNR